MGTETAETAGKAPVAETAAAHGAFTQPARAGLHAGVQGYVYTSKWKQATSSSLVPGASGSAWRASVLASPALPPSSPLQPKRPPP